ncbi:MAG TPA: hypothetical protein VGE24_03645, partial [Emticicia sp.]
QEEIEVYRNDFESSDLSFIENGLITSFNNSQVLGRYNNMGFVLSLNNLTKHNVLKLSFDLNIHDNWDGNLGPDIWQMRVDNDILLNTTFSNEHCPQFHCLPQSYPNNYPNSNNNPKAGAENIDLPGACQSAGRTFVTTTYKISKTILHNKKSFRLECKDMLKEAVADQLCDESWSIDNIQVKVVELD